MKRLSLPVALVFMSATPGSALTQLALEDGSQRALFLTNKTPWAWSRDSRLDQWDSQKRNLDIAALCHSPAWTYF